MFYRAIFICKLKLIDSERVSRARVITAERKRRREVFANNEEMGFFRRTRLLLHFLLPWNEIII